jgi:DNA repair photolyase
MSSVNQGRGAGFNPPNRFEPFHLETLADPCLEADDDTHSPATELLVDGTRSILAENDSPDLGFRFSLNPYRGCEHGCSYCFARPSHEYLGFSAGLDFETKILVKPDAPALLEEALRKKSWEPQVVALSGNTDCYQPVERKLGLTRRCLEVFLKFRNPVGIVTKSALILRDLDLLEQLAKLDLVHVTMSVTTLDPDLARAMEPRAAVPEKRLEALAGLRARGISAGILVAPVIPGLNDEEIPAILRECAARGAVSAGWVMLRLSGAVEPIFVDWLRRELPLRAEKVLNRIREVRGGKLSDSRFGNRMRGEGAIANNIGDLFALMARKYGLDRRSSELETRHFSRTAGNQLALF